MNPVLLERKARRLVTRIVISHRVEVYACFASRIVALAQSPTSVTTTEDGNATGVSPLG